MQRLVIITGASKGIGRCISLETNRKYAEGSIFILVARSRDKLELLRDEMLKESKNNKVLVMVMDFSHSGTKVAELTDSFRQTLSNEKLNSLKELFVFYNHGTLEIQTVEKAADQASKEFQTNVVSVWTLMATIRQQFPLNIVPTQYHINMSSLLSTKIQALCSLYNSTRAARATLFKCLAHEQPNLRVLNYQPGPVYTDMLKQFYDSNNPLYDTFNNDYEEGKFIKPEDTVQKLLQIIETNQFETGTTIDYYDA